MSDVAGISKLDGLQNLMEGMPQIHCPLVHIFTKGLYTRQIFMPKGTVIVSKIHNTQHPYIISMGTVVVYNEANSVVGRYSAPHVGVTMPNTRRLLRIIHDCVWTTLHPLDWITGNENNLPEDEQQKIIERIEDIIIKKRDVYLGEMNSQLIGKEDTL